MLNSKGDNFEEKHFQTAFARIKCINLGHFNGFIGAGAQEINWKTKLTPAHMQS